MNNRLEYIGEPPIMVGLGQEVEDPRDGLTLFGPYSKSLKSIRCGVVATKKGFSALLNFIDRIHKPVYNGITNDLSRPFFPGIESVFGCSIDKNEIIFKEIEQSEIDYRLFINSKYVRTYDLVTLFIEPIIEAQKNDDISPNLWLIVIPEEIYKYCRPESVLPKELIKRQSYFTRAKAKCYQYMPSLFPEFQEEEHKKAEEAKKYAYDAQFHDQLKARLLEYAIPTQIIREIKLDWRNHRNTKGQYLMDLSQLEGHLAWTLSTALFYKSGGKPWQLSSVRPDVCYLGLVYKKISDKPSATNACCAAQMFLDNGDGTIFRGEVGPWYNPESKEYHLNTSEARNLLTQAISSYKKQMKKYPKEIFIHAKTHFNQIEWDAFREAIPEPQTTKISCITISDRAKFKLYRKNSCYPIMRGMALFIDDKNSFLWTTGFVPRLQTALGLEVPSPIHISIDKGDAEISTVTKDILALTKLNYNACQYGDHIPVTLRFADKIGEILTAYSETKTPPLAFKYYI